MTFQSGLNFKTGMNKNALIIFMKNPVVGKVKTRLAKSIGDENALKAYQILLEHTLKITQPLACDKYIFYSDKMERNDNWKQNGYRQYLQTGNDLGERMSHAFSTIFKLDYQRAAIIGSDCYELTSIVIENSFSLLTENDIAIGPAKDGGYYLLAMKSFHRELFKNKTWSSDAVLSDTIKDIRAKKLKYVLLEELNDIDDVEDMHAPPFNRFIPS